MNWMREALLETLLAQDDPDYAPTYFVPASDRRWWMFWKPRWEAISYPSRNQIMRAVGEK